jgi:hypothetical protein
MLRTVFGTALEGLYNALNVNSGRWSETPADTRRHRRACEHQDWYEKTLASYERCFQTCPPSDSFAKSDLNRHTFDETTQSVSPGTLSGLQSADPLEREVLSMAAVDGSIRRVRVAAANATHEIHERLAREVLLVTGLQDKLMSGIPALLLSCILLLGVAKVLIGIDRPPRSFSSGPLWDDVSAAGLSPAWDGAKSQRPRLREARLDTFTRTLPMSQGIAPSRGLIVGRMPAVAAVREADVEEGVADMALAVEVAEVNKSKNAHFTQTTRS